MALVLIGVVAAAMVWAANTFGAPSWMVAVAVPVVIAGVGGVWYLVGDWRDDRRSDPGHDA